MWIYNLVIINVTRSLKSFRDGDKNKIFSFLNLTLLAFCNNYHTRNIKSPSILFFNPFFPSELNRSSNEPATYLKICKTCS